MGIRFRKSISLGKGARINLSRTTPSLSLGPRGASLGIGKRGIYSNFGIPGSGLSVRTRLDAPKSRSHKSSTGNSRKVSTNSQRTSPEREHALDVLRTHTSNDGYVLLKAGLTDEGEIFFLFTDTNEVVTDKCIIRELKKMPEIKENLTSLQSEQRKIWRSLQESSEEASREFIDIYKLTPKIAPAEAFAKKLATLKPRNYARPVFPKPEPTGLEIRHALETEAENNVKGMFGKSKKTEAYIKEHWTDFSEAYLAAWRREKWAFEREQDELESKSNERFHAEYLEEKASLEKTVSNDDDVIVNLAEEWLEDLTIPADVSAQIDCINGKLYLDLDLPEIEDLPPTTTKQLKSGQVKLVDKTQKQLKNEYAVCVLGLAFFLAGSIFNLNANIVEIEISGYTQRRNRDGDVADEYIYSIRFPRTEFQGVEITNPLEDFNRFENRMKLSTAYSFGKIKPYEVPSDLD